MHRISGRMRQLLLVCWRVEVLFMVGLSITMIGALMFVHMDAIAWGILSIGLLLIAVVIVRVLRIRIILGCGLLFVTIATPLYILSISGGWERTRGIFMAEAIPVIGDLRLKTELYRYESGGLPGVVDGTLQTWVEVEDEDAGRTRYVPSTLTWEEVREELVRGPEVDAHFAYCLEIESEHLTGRFVRPNHVFCWAVDESNSSGEYMFAVGVFGDGAGLPARTGYAVAELWNPVVEAKIVAEWTRWRAIESDREQIVFSCPTTHAEMDPKTAIQRGFCWLPPKAIISADDPKVFEAMLQDMQHAGWRF